MIPSRALTQEEVNAIFETPVEEMEIMVPADGQPYVLVPSLHLRLDEPNPNPAYPSPPSTADLPRASHGWLWRWIFRGLVAGGVIYALVSLAQEYL